MVSGNLHKALEALRRKSVLIWGFGREGRSTYRLLRSFFPDKSLTVADRQPPEDIGDELLHYLPCDGWISAFEGFDVIFRSPGIPLLDAAINRAKLTSQTNLFLSCFSGQTIGITGTKGKSTTSSLIYHVLRFAGRNAVLLGNIGLPCLDFASELQPDDIAVFELSCHQLEDAVYSPGKGIFLNIFQDHLDHYGSYDAYISAKNNIFLHQKPTDSLLLGDNLQQQWELAPYAHKLGYGNGDVAIYADRIDIFGHSLIVPQNRKQLPGLHNMYCIGAAFWACKGYGVDDETFLQALESFQGLPHRLRYVATVNGATYYDDSISTICEATIRALEALENVDTLLLGGMDRGIDYQDLIDFLWKKPVPHVVLMPDTGRRIAPMLKGSPCGLFPVKNLEEAVDVAKKVTRPGRICLLSPAAASYGFFKDFAERGEVFCRLVKGVDG